MVDWKVLAAIMPVFFVIYQAFAKLLPKGTGTFLAGAYALAAASILMATLHLLTAGNKSLQLPSKSILITLGMGAGIALGNFGIIKALSLGAPQTAFTLLYYISLLIYGVIFGVVLWHEKLHLIQVAGIALAIVGIFLAVFFKQR